jgi:hypothetical protein
MAMAVALPMLASHDADKLDMTRIKYIALFLWLNTAEAIFQHGVYSQDVGTPCLSRTRFCHAIFDRASHDFAPVLKMHIIARSHALRGYYVAYHQARTAAELFKAGSAVHSRPVRS